EPGGVHAPVDVAKFERGDDLRQRATGRNDGFDIGGRELRQVDVAAPDHVGDHALQAHLLAVFRAVDALHPVVVQLADLGRYDAPAAAAEHLDVVGARLAQQVDHVLEVLDVAALV